MLLVSEKREQLTRYLEQNRIYCHLQNIQKISKSMKIEYLKNFLDHAKILSAEMRICLSYIVSKHYQELFL